MNAPVGWNLHSVVDATFTTSLVSTRSSAQGTVLSLLDEAPRVELSHVRFLADLLGFVVVPFECLDPRSYEQEPEDIRHAIHAFVSVFEPWFDCYVLCPIGHYSIQKHFKMETDRPVYVPDAWRQTFITIEMLLPVLRNMEAKVESLTKRVDDLARQIEHAAEQARRARLQAMDPLLFAVPKGLSVGDDGPALIGPAWGPDMDLRLLQTFRLEEKPGQRNRIEAMRKTLLRLKPKGETSEEKLPPNHYRVRVTYAPMPSYEEIKEEFDYLERGHYSEEFNWRIHRSCEGVDRTPGDRIFYVHELKGGWKREKLIAWGLAQRSEIAPHGYRPATHDEAYEFQKAHPDVLDCVVIGSDRHFRSPDNPHLVWMYREEGLRRFSGSHFSVGEENKGIRWLHTLFVRKDSR